MNGPTIDIRLKRPSKAYFDGEVLKGVVMIDSKTELTHYGVTLSVEGSATLQVSAKTVGLFEAFYSSLKPIQLITNNMELVKPGKIPSGKLEIPFEFTVKSNHYKPLYESYHGVFVNIQYLMKCDMKRPILNKDLQKLAEFLIQYSEDGQPKCTLKPVDFKITPASIKKQPKDAIPEFQITGKIDSVECCITKPFTGEFVIEQCDALIKSIEIQLVRVETCGCAEGFSRDSTEIQNIQIADGDVCRNTIIPIFMIFPRLFTCPSLATPSFKVEFEISLVVLLEGDLMLSENFPITLKRY